MNSLCALAPARCLFAAHANSIRYAVELPAECWAASEGALGAVGDRRLTDSTNVLVLRLPLKELAEPRFIYQFDPELLGLGEL